MYTTILKTGSSRSPKTSELVVPFKHSLIHPLWAGWINSGSSFIQGMEMLVFTAVIKCQAIHINSASYSCCIIKISAAHLYVCFVPHSYISTKIEYSQYCQSEELWCSWVHVYYKVLPLVFHWSSSLYTILLSLTLILCCIAKFDKGSPVTHWKMKIN